MRSGKPSLVSIYYHWSMRNPSFSQTPLKTIQNINHRKNIIHKTRSRIQISFSGQSLTFSNSFILIYKQFIYSTLYTSNPLKINFHRLILPFIFRAKTPLFLQRKPMNLPYKMRNIAFSKVEKLNKLAGKTKSVFKKQVTKLLRPRIKFRINSIVQTH